MTNSPNLLRSSALAAAITAAIAFSGAAYGDQNDGSTKILTAQFEARDVVQVEIGDFHFIPGQVAPIHTHDAPAVGYVAKGTIIYQVEGEKVQILNEGDAFYEPTGLRVLRFDNASATEEAIFLDFNLEQEGEPFIVFPKPPTEAIDRRTLPTIDIADQTVTRVDAYATELDPSGQSDLNIEATTLGLVVEGVVLIQQDGETEQRLIAGQTFALQDGDSISLVNASSETPAKIITYRLN